MDDLISRQTLLNKFEPWLKVKDYSDGELNMLKAILYEIRFMPFATDKNVGRKLGTNLAEVGTDCISRQAAIDALNHELRCGAVINQCGLEMAYEVIEDLPSAQPQIIRCKDCKNWDTTWTNDFSPNYHYCPMVDGVRKEDWFCADAERRTDG